MKLFCTLVVWSSLGIALQAADPAVELNIIPSSRASVSAGQEWARALARLKSARVRIASGQSPKPDVRRTASLIRVTAVIDSGNLLVVPGGRFSTRQVSGLQAWIDQLRTSSGKPAANDRFGLSTEQLKRVHESLKQVVRFSTLDKSASEMLARISRRVGHSIRISKQHRLALDATKVTHELEGMTGGTAMAMILRSAELVFVPQVSGSKIQLVVASENAVPAGWPVGWESKLSRQELVPKIFDMLEIEIEAQPITNVVAAVEGRLETPFFWDEALFEAAKTDPESVKVSVPPTRMSYSNLLKRAFFQAKMTSTLRIDDRGKAFYWVSPRVKKTRDTNRGTAPRSTAGR